MDERDEREREGGEIELDDKEDDCCDPPEYTDTPSDYWIG